MNLKIDKGNLIINIYELMDCLSTEEKQEVADSLSINEDIIKNVTDQILIGYTEKGSCGCHDEEDVSPQYALGQARREIALSANTIAKEQIESLLKVLKRKEEYHQKVQQWAYSLYHLCIDNGYNYVKMFSAYDPSEDEYEVVKKQKCPPAKKENNECSG
jgi:hypothetical protein